MWAIGLQFEKGYLPARCDERREFSVSWELKMWEHRTIHASTNERGTATEEQLC